MDFKLENLMPLLVVLPLFAGIGALLLPPQRRGVCGLVCAASLVTFVLSLVLACNFDFSQSAEFQFNAWLPWVESFGLSFRFGMDSISLWLVLLTTFLMPLVVLGSYSAVTHRVREFYAWLLILEAAMIGTFLARDLIFFYVCFEFTLVPLYFLIGIWGSTQRLKAARVFFLYTFTGSMLTLAGVLYVAWLFASEQGVWTFDIGTLVAFAATTMSPAEQGWLLLALLAGFAVKVPLFPVHTWLPLAHTEAPTAGSVVLAGVLLKLGTYGMVRFALPMCPMPVMQYAPVIGVVAVIGILYTSLICWVQKDIKKLIAYSSVSHLGFCVLGMFALNTIGIEGSVMYMINHGLSTGALFLCVGMIYERFHTRQFRELGGLVKVMPVWAFFMVFFSLASVGLPGLNGFVGEFLTLIGAFTSEHALGPRYAVMAGFGMIFGAIYILYMVGKAVFGPLTLPDMDNGDGNNGANDGASGAGGGGGGGRHTVRDLNLREVVTLAPLAVACLVLGLYPKPMLDTLAAPAKALVQSVAINAGYEPADHDQFDRTDDTALNAVLKSQGRIPSTE